MRRHIDLNQFIGITPAQRIERLRDALADERTAHRDAPAGSYDETVSGQNAAMLEDALDRAETNERLRTERIASIEAERATRMAASQDAQQAALEADLRRRYDLAMAKPVSDAQWEAVRESVLHRHRLKEMDTFDEQVQRQAARYRMI